jgi:hypothetical protein
MWFFNKYVLAILDKYRNFEPLEQTAAIGFTGAVNERPPPCTTPEISEDSLLFGAQVNFNNPGVSVRIKSLSPQYEWMGDNSPAPIDTPITAIAGSSDPTSIFERTRQIADAVHEFCSGRGHRRLHNLARPQIDRADRRRLGLRKGVFRIMNFGAGRNLETGEWAGCRFDTGDWVGSAWRGPEWTPYAQLIADYYSQQVPWYVTTEADLAAPPPVSRLTRVLAPQQYDTLIFGASAVCTEFGLDNGNFIFLNVTDQGSGIPWAVPNKLGAFPLPAIAGINLTPAHAQRLRMPVIKMPEAFFLPAGTELKIDWSIIAPGPVVNTRAILTFAGVQLIRGRAPEFITMANGDEIRVGSRLPWFATVPMGEFQSRHIDDFRLPPGQQVSQYLPAANCNVEIHDAYANFLKNAADYNTAQLLTVKLIDMGAKTFWTPNPSPVTSVFGGDLQVNPAMPFPAPYLLRKGHRMQITMQNNNPITPLTGGTLTFRGVRLCEY